MATKTVLQEVLDLVGKFVVKHDGSWGHADWEDFLDDATKAGVIVTDETKRNLGNILETSKFFYAMGPGAAPKKAAAKSAPKKPKAKAKS